MNNIPPACSIGSRLTPMPHLLTARAAAFHFLLRRNTGDFRFFHKRRRRLKRLSRSVVLVNSSFLPSPFDGSVSLDSLATAVLGFGSGLAMYLSSRFLGKSMVSDDRNREEDVVGEWVLFTSPTPFNRFVLLRCSLLSFDVSVGDGKLLESVNDRLVKEERHFVRLNTGRIPAGESDEGAAEDTVLEYQRFCITTEDGGVVSLDWPATLDLWGERGLDTTVILVPGTPEGSMDKGVRSFVREALRRGVFPVVMNPRGCAGSPLTTARLFTAADSDDISTAVQYITKARPWTTFMGVGWGYGANMMTKYLAEDGERTPLTAAVCIDNPFDLEEITRTSPYHDTLDRQLADGLVHILRSNKELFQGRTKGFDIGKALSSKSVRDFERAISMVTYGFECIEDFYSNSGTKNLVGTMKVPVLFIQNDDVVPLFSIPRGPIAGNPFTSLLLCSLSPSRVVAGGDIALPWVQNLALEWLTAVELGLLKGRHPLLKDIDVTVNPSKGLSLVEQGASGKGGKAKKLLELTQRENIDGRFPGAVREMFKDGDPTSNFSLHAGVDVEKNITTNNGSCGLQNGEVSQNESVETESDENEESNGEESERSQILQTTEVVMNMLDVTMPGTLKAEEKKKVLGAVDRGETIINALQDAVPEDVRERLITAVTAILQSPGNKLKFEKLKLPNVSPGFKSKAPEPSKGPLSAVGQRDRHSPDQIKKSNDLVNGSDNVLGDSNDSTGGAGPELSPPEASQKSGDFGQSQAQDSNSGLAKTGSDWSGDSHENGESSNKEKASSADAVEKASEPGGKAGSTSQGKPSGFEDAMYDDNKVDQDATIAREDKKEVNVHKNEEQAPGLASDQNKAVSTNEEENVGPSPGSSPSESQPLEKEENDNQKKETKDTQPLPDQNKPPTPESSQPGFSVSQAFDALTGIDDSTQVAVNSIFGVLENMISQMEEGNKEENEISDDKKPKDEESKPSSGEQTPKKKEDKVNMPSGRSHDLVCDSHESRKDSDHDAKAGLMNEKHLYGKKSFIGNHDKHLPKILPERCTNLDENPLQGGNFREDISDKQNTKQLDIDTTAALLLDYYPEEGQWKLIEQPPEMESADETASRDVNRNGNSHPPVDANDEENLIEPLYVILDSAQGMVVPEKSDVIDNQNDDLIKVDEGSEELMHLVKVIILDSLKLEVKRRVSSSGLRQIESQLSQDIEKVAYTISSAVVGAEHTWLFKNTKHNITTASEKLGRLDGEAIIRAISSAVWEARYLRQVLPVGVVVGSSLAALRKYFDVSTVHGDTKRQSVISEIHKYGKDQEKSSVTNKINRKSRLNSSRIKKGVQAGRQNIKSDSVMVSAVTAALGASAILAQQQGPQEGTQNGSIMSKSSKEKGNQPKEPEKLDEMISGKNQSNIVTSFTEKAMSVAGPVVPTKEGGEVDHERLVTMLADLGQKGGILRLVGKFALLWGGIRGALSLIDRLILFLHVAEWPLLKRIVGFAGMVLILWSPVVVPLLPTILQSWSTSNPSKMAELASIIGLYVAVFILVMLWGKRVHKYENPFRHYGLDLCLSPKEKIQDFLKGLAGGVALVLLIQSVNAMLGAAIFSWPSHLPSSFDALKWLKGYGQLLLLTIKGFIAATGVVLVEELFFRSWLPKEIATDLSYHQGIIISGLAFSLLQRSLRAIPGSWLLSLALAGARQRTQGDLSVAIGFRTGIMTSSFILQAGQFLTYNPIFPVWIAGTHPLQPFTGVVGISFCLVLALVFYPKRSPEIQKQKPS